MNKILTPIIILVTLAVASLTGFLIITQPNIQYATASYVDEIISSDVFQAGPRQIDYNEDFEKDLTIEENWPIKKSGDRNWWVSSGAYLYYQDGVGKTIQGNLDASDEWVDKFYRANAADTANGYRPQNIFRLVYKKRARDFTQSVYGKINYYEISDSENRNASNGILLFNRYQDEFSLYYAGVRVDGQAVIKKKLNGTYSTLAVSPLFAGQYDRDKNPNLIPLDTWIGIKTVVTTLDKKSTKISLYTDVGRTGNWTLALEVVDDGKQYDKAITRAGYGGIRTDFMDASFDDFSFKTP